MGKFSWSFKLLVLFIVGITSVMPTFANEINYANQVFWFEKEQLTNQLSKIAQDRHSFNLDLSNGDYYVTVFAKSSTPITIEAEEQICFHGAAIGDKQIEAAFEVTVTDQQLNLNIIGSVESIDAIEVSSILKFDFGNQQTAPGYIKVSAKTSYSEELGYGFNNPSKIIDRAFYNTTDPLLSDSVRFVEGRRFGSNSFKINLVPGRYHFSFATGAIARESLYVNGLPAILNITGNFSREQFEMDIPDGLAEITLDGKAGTSFELSALEIKKIADQKTIPPTIWLGGDSTVCNYYPIEPVNKESITGWGQVLPFYLTNDYILRNYATSGQTTKGFREDGAFDAILAQIKPGEYFIVQLGINDRNKYPLADFRANLEYFVDQIRAKGGIPVLVTPQGRSDGFKLDPWNNLTHGVSGWAGHYDMIRIVAREKNTLLIDNANLSSAYYVSIGEEATKKLYADPTHPNYYGALQLARIISEEFKSQGIQIETTGQKTNYASYGNLRFYTPELKNLAGVVQSEFTDSEDLVVSILARNSSKDREIVTIVVQLIDGNGDLITESVATYQVDAYNDRALETVLKIPERPINLSLKLSVLAGDYQKGQLIEDTVVEYQSKHKYILPADQVEGFEYGYPIGIEVAQQADPSFDGWAMLGSNATRQATLEYDARRKSHYIQVYSEQGVRADGSKGSTVLSRDFPASGLVAMEFDVNFYNGVGSILFKNTGATSWGLGHTAISVAASGRNIVVSDGLDEQVLIKNFSELKWYRFQILTNVDTKRYSIKAYDGKQLIAELDNLEYAITNGVQATGIRNINVFLPDLAVDKRINVDNVYIYQPIVRHIDLKALGNGVQVPDDGVNQLELIATALPVSSFAWSLAEDYPGVTVEPVPGQFNRAVLQVGSQAIAQPVTVIATTGGKHATIEIPLSSTTFGIEIQGKANHLIPFTSQAESQYTAVVRDGSGSILEESVTWYLYDHSSLEPLVTDDIYLNSKTGMLTIKDSAQPSILLLRAVLDSDPVVSKDLEVVIYNMKYDFGLSTEKILPGYTKVTPNTLYSENTGFGIDPNTPVSGKVVDGRELTGDYIYADQYFRFKQQLPPGNYRVKLTFADVEPNNLSVGVENAPTQRFRSNEYYDNRIMKGIVSFSQDKPAELVFDVAVVDGVLDIDFMGNLVNVTQYKAMVNALEITKLPALTKGDKPTLYLAGDSTVANYSATDIMAGWGQMLGEFLGPDYIINNRAIGGRSSASFYREGRLEEILLNIKPGDYLLIQFGHNDGTFNNEARYCGNPDYEMLYAKYYIEGAKQRGATPIIVTSVPMHGFTSTATLGTYVASAKKVAEQTNTLLIDLHHDALAYYNNLPGTQQEKQAIVDSYYILDKKGGRDFTHFTKDGARKIAELVYQRLQELQLIPDFSKP